MQRQSSRPAKGDASAHDAAPCPRARRRTPPPLASVALGVVALCCVGLMLTYVLTKGSSARVAADRTERAAANAHSRLTALALGRASTGAGVAGEEVADPLVHPLRRGAVGGGGGSVGGGGGSVGGGGGGDLAVGVEARGVGHPLAQAAPRTQRAAMPDLPTFDVPPSAFRNVDGPDHESLRARLTAELGQYAPTRSELARDIAVFMSPKDMPSNFVVQAVRVMLNICIPRGVTVYATGAPGVELPEMRKGLELLAESYPGALVLVPRSSAYASQNDFRREFMDRFTTKYTYFLEDSAFCEQSDCLERLWMAAEKDMADWEQNHPEATFYRRGDEDTSGQYFPFVVWQPFMIERSHGKNIVHSIFGPTMWRYRDPSGRETFAYDGGWQAVNTRMDETNDLARTVQNSLDFYERTDYTQRYLEDHAFLALTSFFKRYNEEIFMTEVTSRYEYIHFPLVLHEYGARVRSVAPQATVSYFFWWPIEPEVMSWIAIGRHNHASLLGCEFFSFYWGFDIQGSCVFWPINLIHRKLKDKHWRFEEPSTLTPSFYPPNPHRGMQHAQLLMSTWLFTGYATFDLIVDGESLFGTYTDMRTFMATLVEFYASEDASAPARTVYAELGTKEYVRQPLRYISPDYLYPETEYDESIHPLRHVRRLVGLLPTNDTADPPQYSGELEELRLGVEVMRCFSATDTPLPQYGSVSFLVTDATQAAELCGQDMGGPALVHMYWRTGKQEAHIKVAPDCGDHCTRSGPLVAGTGTRIPLPAHATDDSITVREWQYKRPDISYLPH